MIRIYISKLQICLFICIFYLTSCYDDKSTLATEIIPEVSISVSDQSQVDVIRAEYQSSIDIVPTITQKGNNGEHLLYEWALTEGESRNNATFEVIGTEKEFHGIINRPISSQSYLLKLTITDTANEDLQYFYTWPLYVNSSFLDGLLISDSKDGITSDLTLINNSQFTHEYTGNERIFRQIIKTAKGASYNELLTSLVYETSGNATLAHTNQVWAISSTGQPVRFNCLDYSINGTIEDEKLFLYTPAGFQVKTFIRSSQLFLAFTNNGTYLFSNTTGNKFSMPSAVFNGTEINNNIYAANSHYSNSKNHLVWLDKEKGAFYSFSGHTFATPMRCEPYVANSDFDPNDMGDKTAIAATYSQDGTIATFLLKDDHNGEYAIYTLSQYQDEIGYYEDEENWEGWTVISPEQPASAKNKYTVPSTGKTLLDKAVSVCFGHTSNVLYVATADGIYTFTYGMGNEISVSATAQFTPTNGDKITKIKLYQQGQYTNQIDVMTDNPPHITPNEWNNKALIIVTQSDEYTGKVSLVPMRQPAAGTLDISKALIYDGFGKVLDVITTGY